MVVRVEVHRAMDDQMMNVALRRKTVNPASPASQSLARARAGRQARQPEVTRSVRAAVRLASISRPAQC